MPLIGTFSVSFCLSPQLAMKRQKYFKKRVQSSISYATFLFAETIKISLTKVDIRLRNFFYFQLGFVSRIYPVGQGHVSDSFLIHVARHGRKEFACACVVKTHTFNVSISSDRERGQKGLVLPRSSYSTLRRATRTPSSFCLSVSPLA